LASFAKVNAKIGSSDKTARLSALAISRSPTNVMQLPVLACVNQTLAMEKHSNTLEFVVKAPAPLDSMDPNAVTSATVKIIHRVIQNLVNASVNVAGWEDIVTKSARMDIMVKTALRSVPRTCHLRQLAIM
jgi:hypothetical protein